MSKTCAFPVKLNPMNPMYHLVEKVNDRRSKRSGKRSS